MNLTLVLFDSGQHNYVQRPVQVKVKEVRAFVKEQAVSQVDTPNQIAQNASIGALASVSIALPSVPAMKKIVHRTRLNSIRPPTTPRNLTELEITGDYTMTMNGQLFLCFSQPSTENRIVIFATERNLDLGFVSPLFLD